VFASNARLFIIDHCIRLHRQEGSETPFLLTQLSDNETLGYERSLLRNLKALAGAKGNSRLELATSYCRYLTDIRLDTKSGRVAHHAVIHR
jgi:hypothetical protein